MVGPGLPWADSDYGGWHEAPGRKCPVTRLFRFGDEDVPISVQPEGEALKVTFDGKMETFTVLRDHEGAWILEEPTGRRRYWAHAGGDVCRVFADGKVFEFRMPDPQQDDQDDEIGSGPRLVADMPGKVVKILVTVGDQVTVGQPLVIMESMKMETELAASVAGTVASIPAQDGMVVGQGDLLVEIEPGASP